MEKSKILGFTIALVLLLSIASIVTLTKPVSQDQKTAKILINNAEKLKVLINKKLKIINYILLNLSLSESDEAQVNFTLGLIINYTSQGDMYLNISKNLYVEGNYTGAKVYAIKAMQSYHKALELIHELIVTLHIDIEKCCVKEHIRNQTRTGIENNTLIVAFIVAEKHIDRLRELIENMDKTGIEYDFDLILDELASLENLIEEGKTLAEAGNVSDAAKILALVKMKIGHLMAEIHKIGALVAVGKIKMYFYRNFGKENATMIDLILKDIIDRLNKGDIKELMKELKHAFHEILMLKEKHKGGKGHMPPIPPTPPGTGDEGCGCGGNQENQGGKH